jgi:amino acid adenylation domain-containing protein
MTATATPSQTRFWLLDQQYGGNARTLVKRLTIDGPADPNQLRQAIRSVLASQPALRTSLQLGSDGVLRQTIHPVDDVPFLFEHADSAGTDSMSMLLERPSFPHDGTPLCKVAVKWGPQRTDCVFAIHHAVFDAPSTGILLRQIIAAYVGNPALSTDTALAGKHDDEQLAAARSFWTRQLSGVLCDTSLPQIEEAKDIASPRSTVDLELPAAQLRDVARRFGTSPFVQLLAASGFVLSWYNDSAEAVVSVVVDCRGRNDQDVIGCFQNVVPIRLRTEDRDSTSFLDHTLDALLDAIEHAQLPFEEIMDIAASSNKGIRSRLQVICTDMAEIPKLEAAGLKWEINDGPPPAETEYDLTLTLTRRSEERLALSVDYRADSTDERTVGRFAAAVQTTMRLFASVEATPLSQVCPLSSEENAQLRELGYGPKLQRPRESFLDLIAARARAHPGFPAIRDAQGITISYRELEERSTNLARSLLSAGVGKGDRIGIRMPRTPDLLVALLGTLKAGAAFVPMPSEYPMARLQYIADDANLRAVIGDIAISGLPSIPVEQEQLPAHHELPKAAPQDLAYLIYTSGSTGSPKGVVIRHDNLTTMFAGFSAVMSNAPHVFAAATTCAFDISFLELFWPLTEGRTVFLTSHDKVVDELAEPGALYQCTPTMARILVNDEAGRAMLKSLGALLVGGETLPEDLADELCSLVPGPIWNCYGPTETTIWSTIWAVHPRMRVHIGRPLPGEHCHVLDRFGRRLPLGAPGRLFIGGAGVGQGYWAMPELTARRFQPVASVAGERAYDTGDRVVMDPVHGLRFLERTDAQIKILGHRVEREEVETVLRDHPGVGDAVVVPAWEGNALGAFVTTRDPGTDGHALVASLALHARNRLVPVMVPVAFEVVPSFPVTLNGKLDRKKMQDWASDIRPGHVTSPRSGDGVAFVLDAWSEILGRPVEDPDVSFFDAGGNSPLLLRVIPALRRRYPAVSVAELFRFTTARSLAGHLDRRRAVASSQSGRGAERMKSMAALRDARAKLARKR